jgi:transcriptional regulator with XRE-family HTH domain
MGSWAARDETGMAEESFGRRLRSERERRRITLELIAANTKIGVGLLKGLERDDVSRWPSGIFRRSFVRSYAKAIGLDADATLREFLERFPDPQAPVAGAAEGRRTAKRTPVPPRTAPRPVPRQSQTNPQPSSRTVLRLTLADSRPAFSGGRILARASRRIAAASCDAAATVALALAAFVFIDQFWAPLGVAMLCYYLGGILVLGNTPGVCLFAPRSKDDVSRWFRSDDPGNPGPPGEHREHEPLRDLASEAAFEQGFAG